MTTDPNNGGSHAAESAEQMAQIWMEFAGRMASMGLTFKPGSPPPEAARQVRSALLEALSTSVDQYMRSPAFLEGMRQTMDGMIQWRKQYNDMLVQIRHETQGAASEDIDAILATVAHSESRLLERLGSVCDRLDAITQRLDQLESRAAGETESEAGKPADADASRGAAKKKPAKGR